jgi:tetratricopeptide (TPR) repeat protein
LVVTLLVAMALLLLQQPETLSLLGDPLYAPSLPKAARIKAEDALTAARAQYAATPNDVGAIIALEEAHVSLGRIGDALEILTRGLEANPGEARLQLERGRSYIRIRKFEVAQKDLRKAAETLPSAHCSLGLALYLLADYTRARDSYGKCADPGIFGYLSDRRAGTGTAARPDVRSEPMPSTAPPIRFPGTVSAAGTDGREPIGKTYLDGVEQLLAGKSDAARGALKKIVEKNRDDWMEPAYIAAEVDYAKLVKAKRKS